MFDIVVVLIVIISLLVAFLRGFIKEVFGLLGIFASIFVTISHYDYFSTRYVTYVHSTMVADILSAISVFMVITITVIIVNSWIMYLLSPLRLNLIDRISGLVVGLAKGVFLSYLLFYFICTAYHTFSGAAVAISEKSIDKPTTEKNVTKDAKTKYSKDFAQDEEVLPDWLLDSRSYEAMVYLNNLVDEVVPQSFHEKIVKIGDNVKKMVDDSGKTEKKDKTKSSS